MVQQYGGIVEQTASTATSGGTTTLINTSPQIQVFTGTMTQTVVLPDATTYTENGAKFEFYNESSSAIAIHTNGGASLTSVTPNSSIIVRVTSNGSSAGTWAILNGNSALSNPMTTAGDMIYGGAAGAPTRLAASSGSSGQQLELATGVVNWQWETDVTSVSSTYAVLTSDKTIVMSGASFTATLPTAVGFSGKTYTLLHNGTSSSQVYTLATTSSQTIGGVAGGSYALYTNGESLTVYSDGANWQILNHLTSSAPTAYTPSFTAFGTPTGVSFYSWREGQNLVIHGLWTNGTATAVGNAISIGYGGVDTPTGLAINTTIVPTPSGAAGRSIVGSWAANNTGNDSGWVTVNSTTSVALTLVGELTVINGNATGTGSTLVFGELRIPISGWQP